MNKHDSPTAAAAPPPLDPAHELPPETAAEAAAEGLQQQMQKLEAERDALNERWLRALADADNFRKRVQREIQEARTQATVEAVRPFLVVLDGLARAAEHPEATAADLRKGIELLHRQLDDAARKAGLVAVPALHQPFDPHLHEAVEMVDDPQARPGTVVGELQRGYTLNERLVRPAMVRVARGTAPTEA